MRNGQGEMYWIDGSHYKGGWKNGIQDGIGELYKPNESILKGLFQNNIFVGDDKEIVSQHKIKGPNDSTISNFLASKRNFSTDNENNRTDRSSSSKTKNNSSRNRYVSAKKENNDFKRNQSQNKMDDISTIIDENKFNTTQANQIDKQKDTSQTDFAINKSPK